MTRSEKCTWLVQVWREHHDPAYARVAQHMYVGASPADICLFEGISQAQLRGIIVALATTLRETQAMMDAHQRLWEPGMRSLRERLS